MHSVSQSWPFPDEENRILSCQDSRTKVSCLHYPLLVLQFQNFLMLHSHFSSLFLAGSPHPNLKHTQFSSFSALLNLVIQMAINYIKANCHMTYSVILGQEHICELRSGCVSFPILLCSPPCHYHEEI